MRLSFLLCLLIAGCASHKPLPHLGEVPDFQLTDQAGKPFDRAALSGRVWVADFIYTTCPGPCPRMSSHMGRIQKATLPSVRLISFTVDPVTDTPEVLSAYGRKFGADPARWTFLTGDKARIEFLNHDGFKLGTGLDHSTRFVLVDKKGRIRGYYGIADGDPVEKISADAARLQEEGD